jgi:hypothetical protein
VHPRGVFEQVKGSIWLEQFHGNSRQFYREVGRTQEYVVLHRTDPRAKRTYCVHLHGPNCGLNVIGERHWTIPYRDGRWTVQKREPAPPKSPASRLGEWVPLLNGKDLAGWERVAHPKMTWSAEDGELVGRASGLPGGGGVITHRADYDNFHLRLEVQLSEGPISGLLLRCGPPQHGAGGNKCYLVVIGGTGTAEADKRTTGNLALFTYSGTTQSAASLKLADAEKVELKPGEWFPMEVQAEGNHFRVFVKGKKVVDYKDPNRTFSVGRLGLCCAANAVGRFRKVEIKELPAAKPAGGQ